MFRPGVHFITFKIIKVGTIILISFMAMTCKIIAMFTIGMGALALKVTLLIYGWMSTPVVLVTSGLILLVKINKIKQKNFQIIKYIYAQKLNKQGFIKTRFLVRKRKLLDIHRQILKTVLFITCISEVTFNLRK